MVILVVLVLLAAGLGLSALAPQAAFAAAQGAASISAGGDDSCALESGAAYCWGENDVGELGDGSATDSSTPVAVDTSGVLAGKTLTQISTGDYDTCVLDSAGTAYCWGNNAVGELGDGTTGGFSSVPVAVDTSGVLAGKTLTQISAGTFNTCALDSAGAAYCWGYGGYGQVGDGSTSDSSVPVAVDTSGVLAGKTLTQISVGEISTCALDSAGAAYCWGNNAVGELGDGTMSTTPQTTPAAVYMGGKTFVQVSAGAYDACALNSGGAAYCWGLNQDGELGDGITVNSAFPLAVETSGALAGKTLTQISAGHETPCAVDSTGAAYCWGFGATGDLGNGSTTNSSVPVTVDTSGVLAGKTLTEISGAVGNTHACATDSAGAFYCWGDNYFGDLGNDSTAQSDVPVLAGPQAPSSVTAIPGDTTATVSWTPPANLDGGTLTGYTATASPGSETCTTGGTSCTVTGLTDGTSYSITVLADTTAGDSGASTPVTVVPRGPSIDQQVTVNGTGTVRTRSFSTTTAGETLLAFASSDGPRGKGRQRVAVRGAGLTWTLVNRANAQAGDAEIWQATVPGTVTGARIRSTPAKPGYRQDLTVVALENTGGVGASARASGASGAPALSLTTTQDGSLIFAVGFDWDNDIGRTLPAGWLMLNQRLGSRATDTYWSQYTSTPIAQAGTAVQVGDTAPVTDRWNLAAVEVTGDTG